MREYVTEQILYCVKNNDIYPQYIQISPRMELAFGTVGLTLRYFQPRGCTKCKHINYWQSKTANEINTLFHEQEYQEEN